MCKHNSLLLIVFGAFITSLDYKVCVKVTLTKKHPSESNQG